MNRESPIVTKNMELTTSGIKNIFAEGLSTIIQRVNTECPDRNPL